MPRRAIFFTVKEKQFNFIREQQLRLTGDREHTGNSQVREEQHAPPHPLPGPQSSLAACSVPTCWVRRLMWLAGEYCLAACFSASRWSSAVTRLGLYLRLKEPSSPSFCVLVIPEWCLCGWHEPAEKEKSSHPLKNQVLNKATTTTAKSIKSTDTLLDPRQL